MKIIYKSLCVLLLFVSLSLLLVSCGKKESEQVVIKFAAMKTFGKRTMPQLIEKFEQENPNIKIEFIEMAPPSNSTEIHQFLVTSLAGSSNAIDVFTADAIWFSEFAEAGWLMNLNEVFDKNFLSDYFDGPIQTVSYKGNLVGLPWYMDGGFLYYRKDLLDKYSYEPPETFSQLVSIADEILEKENNPNLKGFIWQAKQAEVLVCDLVEFLGGKSDIVDENGNVKIGSTTARKAMQMMYDLIYKYKISPKAINTYDEEPSRTVFTNGDAIFLRNWSYVWPIAQDPEQSKVVGKVGIVPLPHIEGNISASTLGGYQYGVSAKTKHKDAAIKFLTFMSNVESQKYFALNMGFAPTRKALYEDPELKEKAEFLTTLKDVFLYSKPRPNSPFYPEVSLALQSELSKLLIDQQDVDITVKNLETRISEIYKQ